MRKEERDRLGLGGREKERERAELLNILHKQKFNEMSWSFMIQSMPKNRLAGEIMSLPVQFGDLPASKVSRQQNEPTDLLYP